jgi:hypothetical protein
MRIGLVSYHPVPRGGMQPLVPELLRVYRYAANLAAHGCHVLWLCPVSTLEVLTAQLGSIAVRPSLLPPTCRYIVPCRAYALAGIQLCCPDEVLWQQRPFHTRLFTLFCLWQQGVPCDFWHAWGSFPIPYLTVYTARFLGCPAVVTCDRTFLPSATQYAFECQWVWRHAALLLVEGETERQQLSHDGVLADTSAIRYVGRDASETASIVRAWYQQLQGVAGKRN